MDATKARATQIALLGGAMEDRVLVEVVRSDIAAPVQANKHQWSIIEGLEAATTTRVRIISSLMISDYPRNPRILVRSRVWHHVPESDDIMVGFINVLVLKHITRFLSCLASLVRWGRRRAGESASVVLVYGSNSAQALAALAARCFVRRMRLIHIVTDPPSPALPYDGAFRRSLRIPDRWMIGCAMRRMDGLVVLSPALQQDFAPQVRAVVMEGIVSRRDIELMTSGDDGAAAAGGTASWIERSPELVVMFCGTFTERNGVALLLDGFQIVDEEHCELWLYGKGDLEDKIRRAAAADPRIHLGCFVSAAELAKRLLEADVLVSLRPAALPSTRYSFPSKLMEYLLAGKPVISTPAHVPADYKPYLFLLEEETPSALAAAIRRLQRMPRAERQEFGARARAFVLREKNYRAQGERLARFIDVIALG